MITENIRFEANKLYGICGRNESGKSTLIDILCKLRIPQFMQCRMNETLSFDLIARIELRKQISYISQKPYLFEGTIGENIHCSNPNASIDDVTNAAKLGGVFLSVQSERNKNEFGRNEHRRGGGKRGKRGRRRKKGGIATDFVEGIVEWNKKERDDGDDDDANEGMWKSIFGFFKKIDDKQVQKQRGKDSDALDLYPVNVDKKEEDEDKLKKVDYGNDILNYEIKANGMNVSGGLKQSIALSRAFLRKDAKIIVCDESFNSMDMVKKNSHIYPNLFEFVKQHKMTLIIISHDILECFADLDHIIVLDKGTLHKQGTHQHLFANSELYRQLCGK